MTTWVQICVGGEGTVSMLNPEADGLRRLHWQK